MSRSIPLTDEQLCKYEEFYGKRIKLLAPELFVRGWIDAEERKKMMKGPKTLEDLYETHVLIRQLAYRC